MSSYWAATAAAEAPLPALTEDAEADCVIVGAGFSGLSAAYRLCAGGRSCLVLEANAVGWGASGRNGGMVVPRFKHTFAALAARYGAPTARDMREAALTAVDLIERIVRDENIDCGFSRCGHLTPVTHARDAARFEADVRWLEREAGDQRPSMLTQAETERRIGARLYVSAYFEPRGGAVHPLRLCQGLADAVRRRGGRIVQGVARAWRRDGDHVVVEVDGARVRARRLLLATNGYTDLAGAGAQLKRRVVPVVSSLLATERLDERRRRDMLPLGNVVTDAKRLTNYYRMTPDGRLIFGGRGGASNRESMRAYKRLAGDMQRIFPSLRDVAIDHMWSGRVAVTLDGLPRLGRLAPNVQYAMGYNGRGVALSMLLGHMLADDEDAALARLGPLAGALDPIRLHALHVPGKKLVAAYYRTLDALGL